MTAFHRLAPVTGLAALLLAGCSTIDRVNPFSGGGDDDGPDPDKAGRIAMILTDNELEPDPAMATVSVDLEPAEAVLGWFQSGGDSTKSTGHVIAGETFAVEWTRDVGTGSDNDRALTAQPVAADGRIFVLDAAQRVVAVSADTGERLWDKQIESTARYDNVALGGGLAVSGNRLIVASGFGYVLSLDVATGREIWRQTMQAPMVGAPTIYEGRIFVSSNNNELFALSFETGDVDWTDQAIAESARVLSSPSAAAVEDLLVAPFTSGELIAYLSSNGRRLWTDALSRSGRFTPISQINDIAARPVLHRGLVFAASQSGILAAIDGRSGQRVWALPFGSTQAPAISGEFLFAVSVDAEVICVEARTGRVVWYQQLEQYKDPDDAKGRIAYSGPIIASNRLVLGKSTGGAVALSPQTGQITDTLEFNVARVYPRPSLFIEPIAYNGRLIFLNDSATLISVR